MADPIWRYTLAGLGYGTLLFLCGFMCAGFGHGTYLPIVMFGSPLSFIPVVGFFAAPFFWAGWGFIVAKTWRFNVPLGILLLHTLGVFVVLWSGSYFENAEDQWGYLRRAYRLAPAYLWLGLAIYLVGQIASWRLVLSKQLSHARLPSE